MTKLNNIKYFDVSKAQCIWAFLLYKIKDVYGIIF